MFCVTLAPLSISDLQDTLDKAEGSDVFFEYRLDLMSHISINEAIGFFQLNKSKLILSSCYPKQSASYLGDFLALLQTKPAWVQIDSLWPEFAIEHLYTTARENQIPIIVASHPGVDELRNTIDWISFWKSKRVDFIKVVLFDMALDRGLELIQSLSTQDERVICFIGADKGSFTRFINRNHRLIYCCLEENKPVVQGQPSLTYCQRVSKQILNEPKEQALIWSGLIGDKILHSPGRVIHNIWNEYYQTQKWYFNIPLKNANFEKLLPVLRALDGINFSITTPYKEKILNAHSVQNKGQIANINTIVSDAQSSWIGYNTDHIGILRVLEKYDISSKDKICVLGSGPVAQSVIFALTDRGITHITCLTRDIEKAQTKLKAVDPNILIQSYDKKIHADVIISTLPYRASPKINLGDNPHLLMDVNLKPESWAKDLATKYSCDLVDGKWMWLYQAIEQFKLFNPSIDVDSNVLEELAGPELFATSLKEE